jgi:predicted nucleotide-binding protein (sugar kinase/HSP70/actin superfamily)
MESVECPSCHRKFNDTTLLSLHHEYEPCFESNSSSSSASKTNFYCPICDEIFYDPHVLQIHVNEVHDNIPVHRPTTTTSDNLYAQELARRERMKIQYAQHQNQTASAISYEQLEENDDAQIARMLQEEENAQSFQEFQVN